LLTAQDADTGLWHNVNRPAALHPLHTADHVDRQLTGFALSAQPTQKSSAANSAPKAEAPATKKQAAPALPRERLAILRSGLQAGGVGAVLILLVALLRARAAGGDGLAALEAKLADALPRLTAAALGQEQGGAEGGE
jgi:hypothetical protein